MTKQRRWFFVINKPAHRSFRAPKQYEVQLLNEAGESVAEGYVDSAEDELVIEGIRVDKRVLQAAMAQAEGKGTYVDEAGNPIQPF